MVSLRELSKQLRGCWTSAKVMVALLNLRNTPRDQVLGSPAQRLQARRLRSKLPTITQLLNPRLINPQEVNRRLMSNRLQQKMYYDESARPLTTLQCGDQVRIQTPVGHTQLGVIKRPPTAEQPRSYMVTVGSKDYRRNRRNLQNHLQQQSTRD